MINDILDLWGDTSYPQNMKGVFIMKKIFIVLMFITIVFTSGVQVEGSTICGNTLSVLANDSQVTDSSCGGSSGYTTNPILLSDKIVFENYDTHEYIGYNSEIDIFELFSNSTVKPFKAVYVATYRKGTSVYTERTVLKEINYSHNVGIIVDGVVKQVGNHNITFYATHKGITKTLAVTITVIPTLFPGTGEPDTQLDPPSMDINNAWTGGEVYVIDAYESYMSVFWND